MSPYTPEEPIDYRTLDFESLKQRSEKLGKVFRLYQAAAEAEHWRCHKHQIDYCLNALVEMNDEMERRFPEELKALKASADWVGSPAYCKVKQDRVAKLNECLNKYLPGFYDAPWGSELEARLLEYLHTLIQCARPLVEQYPLDTLVEELVALSPSYMGNLEQHLTEEIKILCSIRELFVEANQIREGEQMLREVGGEEEASL